MNDQVTIRPPVWFWVLATLLLVWNLAGVAAFITQMLLTPEEIANMPADQQRLYNDIPIWATIAFGFAVWGGALGCLVLMLRHKLSKLLLILSLIGVLVQMFHAFILSNSVEVYGPGSAIMPSMVMLVALFLVWFSHWSDNKGWLQ